MSFDALERSSEGGRPVELYTFRRGPASWAYTSADRDITVGSAVYKAVAIRRPRVEQGPEVSRSNMTLNTQKNLDVLKQYRVAPPADEVTLVIEQYHFGDAELSTIWQGSIQSVDLSGEEAMVMCAPRTAGLRNIGLRRMYQKQCPHVLYGPDCRVDQNAFKTTGAAVFLAGLELTVLEADALPDGYFVGGYVRWEISSGVFERRSVLKHIGAILTIDVQMVGLVPGASVDIFPGCKHNTSDCTSKFSNILNYGGMPYIPLKNPFGADPVY